MHDLVEFLTTRGYQRIPLTRSGVGHFHVKGLLNGVPIEVLVDTGASTTIVALAVVARAGLATEPIDGAASGAGRETLHLCRVLGADVSVNGFAPHVADLIAMDFTHVNEGLEAKGSATVDLILGVDVFNAHAAVVDYASQSLFLTTTPVPAVMASLPEE